MNRQERKAAHNDEIARLRANKKNCAHCAHDKGITTCAIYRAADHDTVLAGDMKLFYSCPLFEEEKAVIDPNDGMGGGTD